MKAPLAGFGPTSTVLETAILPLNYRDKKWTVLESDQVPLSNYID